MSDGAVLTGKRVAMLVEDEFEDRELTGPLGGAALAGVTVTIVGRLPARSSTENAARQWSPPISPPAQRA
jgi:hypothetical protein